MKVAKARMAILIFFSQKSGCLSAAIINRFLVQQHYKGRATLNGKPTVR